MKVPIAISWSGGKDCAMMLYELQRSPQYEPSTLLVTLNEEFDHVSIHGTPNALIDRQARSVGLPLKKMFIPQYPPNELYETRWNELLEELKEEGIRTVAFGDLQIEEIKIYREKHFSSLGMTPIFPVWKRNTREFIHRFLDTGFRAVVTSVNRKMLDASFAGRKLDEEFLKELPSNVDPCGENGEFHTFVYDGPNFKEPVQFAVKKFRREDEYYRYCELEPIL